MKKVISSVIWLLHHMTAPAASLSWDGPSSQSILRRPLQPEGLFHFQEAAQCAGRKKTYRTWILVAVLISVPTGLFGTRE